VSIISKISASKFPQCHYRGHRRQRLRKIFARVRHHLRGGPAPLRRIAFRLRPANSRAYGKTGRRRNLGDRAGGGDSAEKFNTEPRSNVATATEIYDYLRLLFARCGQTFCIKCGAQVRRIARTKSLRGFCRLRRQAVLRLASVSNRHVTAAVSKRGGKKTASARLRKSFVKRSWIFRSAVSTGFTRRDESRIFLSGNAARRRFSKPVYVLVDRLAVNPESRAAAR